jgi:hypothetical protein
MILGLAGWTVAASQDMPPSCSSDGVRAPTKLLERFISADCADCWTDATTPRPGVDTAALDWIVPGSRGDDAPLAVAASRDATQRLQSLGNPIPTETAAIASSAAQPARGQLRVAHGLAMGGYIGASIEWRDARKGSPPVKAWLALVETLPAGTEGSPVERNMVRNVLIPAWNSHRPLSDQKSPRLYESRPMNIPEGARPERLRVIGWVEDARGRVQAIAQSRCAPPGQRG